MFLKFAKNYWKTRMTKKGTHPAVFADRDGTLIDEVNFLHRVEDLSVFPFTSRAIESLKKEGFKLIVITNQSGIGRGLFTVDDMNAIHRQMQIELDDAIDAFFFCPHLPSDNCVCRKPRTGMIDQAAREFDIDIENSWMVGDKKIDVECGVNAGVKTALVATGYGQTAKGELSSPSNIFAADFFDAAEQIIAHKRKIHDKS